MNAQCFKTIFSKRLGCLVAVGEHAASQGKGQGQGQRQGAPCMAWGGFVGVLAASFAAVSLAWAQPAATALPTGAAVAQGAVGISTSGAAMTMQQTTAKAVVNWQSFDIGSGARVNIQQPGADSVMLNRVTGPNPSQIFGQLSANGQVVLANPNGVLFGRDGSVTATSFTASTLGISDANFMAGNLKFEPNGSTAGVVNQGSIKATGGYVALLGASVSNEGQIETRGGTAYLAAAEAVRIPVSGSGRIKLELTPGSLNAAVSNSKDGTIVTQGGQVYMQAAALQDAVASIIQSGRIDTTGEQGGAVHVLADGGQIRVDGSITANSTKAPAGGDIYIGRDKDSNALAAVGDASGAKLESQGGFIETSGKYIALEGIQIKAAKWLIDPVDIEINNNGTPTQTTYSQISNQTINAALNSGVDVEVTTAGAPSPSSVVLTPGTSPGTSPGGNILVSGAISKTSGDPASLTLTADNNIIINQAITSNAGALNLNLTAKEGSISGTGNIAINGGTLALNNGNINPTVFLSGVISGKDTKLTKTGAGRVILTGNNTYTGATTVSAGTLQVGNGANTGRLGTGAVSLDTGGNLTFYRSDMSTIANNISSARDGVGTINYEGTNSSSNAGQSIYLVTGNNSNFSGTINASGSRLQVTNANQLGGAAINVSGGGTLYLIGATVNNKLSLGGQGWTDGTGFGQLGALRLQGATYSGNITLTSNTSIGAVNSTGIVSGVISGLPTASLQINASSGLLGGNVYFTNTNTYSGTTTIASGTLQLGASGTTGTLGSGEVINNGTLNFNRSNAMTVDNTISGTGTVNQTGSGTTTLTGTNTYTGATTISAGALQLGDGGNKGSIDDTSGITTSVTTTITNRGTFIINRSDDVTLSKVISGSGAVRKAGSGTTKLTATNTYTGTTTVSGGTLQIGDGGSTGALGTGAVTLSNNANLSFVRSAATSISNSISGTGNVSASITGSASELTVSSSINLTGGTVNLAADSNITVSARIVTTNTTASAVLINAGRSTAAGTSTGGDLSFSDTGNVTVGTGGRATLMTGSVSDNSVLTTLVGSGSGNFRYNSDESTTNFTTALGAGRYAIYRQAPTITAAVNNATKTYDGQSYSGSSGIGTLSGLRNGDTNPMLGTVSYSSGVNASATPYALNATAASGLGYSVALTPGTLTINKANLTQVTAAKTYDGTTNLSSGTLTVRGVNGEEFTTDLAKVVIASKDVRDNASNRVTNIASLALTGKTDAALASNYNLSSAPSVSNTVAIQPRPINVAGSVAQDKTFDATTAATVLPGQLRNLVAGESLGLAASGTFEDANVGVNKAVTARYTLSDGANGLASNYVLSNATEVLRATILAASLSPLTPVVTPSVANVASRVVVSGSGSAGAAVGVADEEIDTRKECSIINPEKCECQESTIPGVELCYAPSDALNKKD